jgi:hypothetical protein
MIVVLAAAMPAAAQDKPFSMVGTWLVSGQAVGMGESLHPEHSNRDNEPKVHAVNLRFVFDKQDGNNFWGTSTGKSGTSERILGAISRDGKTGVLINARGNQQVISVLDSNTIEGCYASQGPKYVSAACTMWKRQP